MRAPVTKVGLADFDRLAMPLLVAAWHYGVALICEAVTMEPFCRLGMCVCGLHLDGQRVAVVVRRLPRHNAGFISRCGLYVCVCGVWCVCVCGVCVVCGVCDECVHLRKAVQNA